jgi:hypothetical protein
MAGKRKEQKRRSTRATTHARQRQLKAQAKTSILNSDEVDELNDISVKLADAEARYRVTNDANHFSEWLQKKESRGQLDLRPPSIELPHSCLANSAYFYSQSGAKVARFFELIHSCDSFCVERDTLVWFLFPYLASIDKPHTVCSKERFGVDAKQEIVEKAANAAGFKVVESQIWF